VNSPVAANEHAVMVQSLCVPNRVNGGPAAIIFPRHGAWQVLL